MNSIMRKMGRLKEKSSAEKENPPSRRERLAEAVEKKLREQYPGKSGRFIQRKVDKITTKLIMEDAALRGIEYWAQQASQEENSSDQDGSVVSGARRREGGTPMDYETCWDSMTLWTPGFKHTALGEQQMIEKLKSVTTPEELSQRLLNPLIGVDKIKVIHPIMGKFKEKHTRARCDILRVALLHIEIGIIQQAVLERAKKTKLVVGTEWQIDDLFSDRATEALKEAGIGYLRKARAEFIERFHELKEIT